MWARQIVQPTDIHSPDGKMEIYSFSLSLTLPPPFNQTYYVQLIPKCERNRFVFCAGKAPFLLSVICRACCRSTVETNSSFPSSPHPTCRLSFPINLLQSLRQHIYFHSVITPSKKCNNKLSSLLHFSFVPPPSIPSAVLLSVVRVRTLVIPEIPDCEIRKYFSTRALVYRYVYIINMPLLFLHCRQKSGKNSVALPNKHAADIYKTGHPVCSLDVARRIKH